MKQRARMTDGTLFAGRGRRRGMFLRAGDGEVYPVGPHHGLFAFPGDRVRAELVRPEWARFRRGGRHREVLEARITDVLERGRRAIVGTYHAAGNRAWMAPRDSETVAPLEVERKADVPEGATVAVDLGANPAIVTGKVIKAWTGPDSARASIEQLIYERDLPREFGGAALAEADRFPDRIEPAELARREDLRGLEVIVIDPADAKDHDDAVSWEPEPGGGGRLGVHIADVSWFVRPGSALDSEALARGVSAYLPDRVLPMLPPRLSGDLCSLVEGKDRLARTVFIEYDSRGNTRGGRICESVIRPAAGLDYDTVWGLLSDAGARHPRAAALRAMDEFAQVLRRRRFAAGSLDFNLGERKVELDAQGEPARVSMRRTNRAHWLIEEFMIAANEFTGHALARAGLGIWRIHEPPDMDDVAELEEFLAGFGVKLRRGTSGRSLRPQDFQAVLERFRGTREEFVVHRKVLQALKLARYAEFNEGHFGLALKDYTHFTSPIRRYADLAVHRLLAGRGEGRYTVRKLGEVARLVSGLERRAEEAERDCVGMLVMRLLAKRLGETVEGTVSRLEKWGAFVDLDDMGVEALLRSDDISRDRFRVSRDGMSMRGKRSGVTVQVGQRVRAIIARVDARLRQVDLAPEED